MSDGYETELNRARQGPTLLRDVIPEAVAGIKREKKDLAGITIDEGWLTITWGGYEYEIELGRIDSAEKLLGWLVHLEEKSWVPKERLILFLKVVAAHFEFDIRLP